MKEIGEYKTIIASKFEELDRKVNESIKQGFQPFGSPFVTGTGEKYIDKFLACQAMVRYF